MFLTEACMPGHGTHSAVAGGCSGPTHSQTGLCTLWALLSCISLDTACGVQNSSGVPAVYAHNQANRLCRHVAGMFVHVPSFPPSCRLVDAGRPGILN